MHDHLSQMSLHKQDAPARALPRHDLVDTPRLGKAQSGIRGLDEITGGGLPRGRPTLICGGAGSGKTLFAMEFLVRGASEFGEPGVFMAFEETEEELVANVTSLGFDLRDLETRKLLAIDHVHVERSEIEEAGEFDLEGLFVRIQLAVETVGAKRVVLDTIETLFSGLPNPGILRSELRRLFRWLKDRGLTVVLTGETGNGSLTRQGLEEYVSDCVIFLDHRVVEQISTRRLRIVKYRGSQHGTNEYPFLIDEGGISILPVTSIGLVYQASTERVSSGVARLDEMLGGGGFYKGSSVLVSGTAGTGKTSLAASFAFAACARRTRCAFFAFEESAAQLIRNMRSIGVDLQPHLMDGALRVVASRPTVYGIEMHLVTLYKVVTEMQPEVIIIDPITNLVNVGSEPEVRSMLTRLIDFLKKCGITAMLTTQVSNHKSNEPIPLAVSSLIDTWLRLEVIYSGGEFNRTMTVLKSRGMANSNQVSEFKMSSAGIELADTYLGPGEVVMGSARVAREAEDRLALAALNDEIRREQALLERRRQLQESRIAALHDQFAVESAEMERMIIDATVRRDRFLASRKRMATSRRAFAAAPYDDAREEGETS